MEETHILAVQPPFFVYGSQPYRSRHISSSLRAPCAGRVPQRVGSNDEGRMFDLLGQAGLGPVFIPLVWSITLLSYLGAGNKVSSIGVAFSLTAVLT